MKGDKKVILSIFWIIMGAILIGLSVAEKLDAFWSGMGSSLFVIGLLQLLRIYRLHNNTEYQEKREIEINDERNRFLRNKAWAWAGYLFVLIAAISCIIFKIIGQDVLSFAASGFVCIILSLFWISYLILKRKY